MLFLASLIVVLLAVIVIVCILSGIAGGIWGLLKPDKAAADAEDSYREEMRRIDEKYGKTDRPVLDPENPFDPI